MAAAAADSIHMAARNNEIDAVRSALEADPALLNAQDKIKRVPLHLAAWAGHLQITELLLGKGADPNADALDNMVPLAFAAQNGHTEVCRALLAAKADPNHANTKTGKSPLMTAASKAKLDVVKLLVESGADIKQQTRGGKTAVGFVNAKNNHADELTKLLATDDSSVVGEAAAAAADGEGGARGKKRKGKKSKNRQVKVKGEKWVNPNKLREAAEEQQRSASAATAADIAPTPATATDAAAAAPAASSPAAGGADDAMQQQLDQVNAALASQPCNEMLLQLKSDIEQGMQLAAELGGGGGGAAAEPSGDAAEAAAQAAPTAEGSIGPRPPPKKKKKKAPSGPALSFADELE